MFVTLYRSLLLVIGKLKDDHKLRENMAVDCADLDQLLKLNNNLFDIAQIP